MDTPNGYLDRVMRQHGITSDYALAQLLGVRRQAVSDYRRSQIFPSAAIALRIAQLLGLPPELVLLHRMRWLLTRDKEQKAIAVIEKIESIVIAELTRSNDASDAVNSRREHA
ncbi:transcriptional regulator with XRE-family HTH domain [Constrictibacter sp. MBR-5]|jgi:transcriptional regulator with XRE-family HTH domain|uniref:helix-turn-helix transcriptional regulator n=1 Tax=Constrictibacter sp. MBR-5 TaxID=3156467 RepID=UPI003399C288